MLNILIPGAFGNVGRKTVAACLAEGERVTVLEADTKKARRLARSLARSWAAGGAAPTILLGDMRDPKIARRAVAGQDAILHLAALIPPAADRFPDLARSVNVGGTANLISAIRASARAGAPLPRLRITTRGDAAPRRSCSRPTV